MFSYRHAFHAANHADVLKHTLYLHVLDYYQRKDTAYTVIDTHAGAGLYDLEDDWAQTKSECEQGLDRVLEAKKPPPMVVRYLDIIAELNPDGLARYYPGSPWLALSSLRPQDSFHGFELHPTEFPVLQQNINELFAGSHKRVKIFNTDGFENTARTLPPASRRGIMMMDPSYEAKTDYKKVMQSIEAVLKRFAQCCFILWYPLVQRHEVKQLQRQLESIDKPWLHACLKVKKPTTNGFGLHGSAMFIINPPWTLSSELKTTLPWLKNTLAQDSGAGYSLKEHKL